ncbi:hypothetical protein AB9P05_21065 [Roseivirga sp. BDSF3-8]|uniref:hypothetical protein n=1 Tax=Roseivirga sp. BDSF3-8 TaxID=3241598 RepID=UPI003531E941
MPEHSGHKPGPTLDKYELDILMDKQFLLTKHRVTDKAQQLLSHTRDSLIQELEPHAGSLPEGISWQNSKISRGENYGGLPYLVLDCPKAFTARDVFTFRTMIWWGNEISATLHLQGSYLRPYRSKVLEAIARGYLDSYYISVGDSPWEYHFQPDNYLPATRLGEAEKHRLHTSAFIKIATKWSLDKWLETPVRASEAWKEMAGYIF